MEKEVILPAGLPSGSASSGKSTQIDILSDSVSGNISEPDHFLLFPDNAFYHKLTPSERITLAGKYLDIPPPSEHNSRDGRKKKDKFEIVY